MTEGDNSKIKCLLSGIEKVDTIFEDTIRVSLDFTGIDDVDRIMDILRTRKSIGEEVTLLDAFVVSVLIRQENRRRN